MSRARLYLSVTATLLIVAGIANSELFTAIVELERVLHAENEIAQDLKAYIETEQERINTLRSVVDNFEQHSSFALSDPEKHVSNPVNAFIIVKRFTTDWNHVMNNFVRTNTTNEFLERLASKTNNFPSQEDLTGAAMALLRLQDTYALSTTTLAHGDVQGNTGATPMTAGDCFELGRLAYVESDFYHTILWMNETLRRLEADPDSTNVNRAYVLDYLAYATYMQDNVREALRLSEELLKLDPANERVESNVAHYKQIITE
jgi:prolyl 4-hydroxylase